MSKRVFGEEKARFIIACVILGLEFIHRLGYVHRNIKPENIIFDKTGYVKICDFKLLRDASQTNYYDTSGTAGYMAPEVIFRQNHGCCSDIFSLGVVSYELMLGKRPYISHDRKSYIDHIIKELVQVKHADLPEGWSHESADFINRCLQRRPNCRLGYNGIEELKEHQWFDEFNWDDLEKKKMKVPFIPSGNRNFKPRTKEQVNPGGGIKSYIEYLEITKKFEGYYYDEDHKPIFEPEKDPEYIHKVSEKDIASNFDSRDAIIEYGETKENFK